MGEGGAKRSRGASVRVHLSLLVVTALAPALALLVRGGLEQRALARERAEEGLRHLLAAVAFEHQKYLEATHQLLLALAELPAVRNLEPERCSETLARIRRASRAYANLGVADPQGRLVCSALPAGGEIRIADRPYFSRALERKEFTLGDYQVGRVTGTASVNAGYPILDEATGNVRGVVFAALDLEWIREVSSRTSLPAGSVLVVFDREGTLLAESPPGVASAAPGRPSVPRELAARAARGGGLVRLQWPDGTPRFYAAGALGGPVPDGGIGIAVGLTASEIFGAVDRRLAGRLGLLGAVALLAGIGAWGVGEVLIARPARAIEAAARRRASGDLSARTGIGGRGELAEVARAFDAMADSLERRERELRASEEKFRKLFEQTLHPISLNSWEDGRYVDANEEFLRLFGYARDEVVGKTPRELGIWADPEVFRRFLRELRERGEVRSLEASFRGKDGRRVVALFSAALVEIGGKPHVISIARDITDRVEFERALARARDEALAASRAKSLFLANMSHEIRTPLNVILGYGELLGERIRELGDPADVEMVEAVDRASRRLLDTVTGVLDLARLETGDFSVHPADVELGSLAREVLAEYRREGERKGLGLSLREEERASVRADRYCLRNALARLVDNAIKFTPAGRVEVRLWRDPSGELCLDVADTGIGIEEGYLSRLFEPFSQASTGSTRRFEGAGLGLALARRYLERTGASLEVWSQSGAGSIFRIRFPRTPAGPVPAAG